LCHRTEHDGQLNVEMVRERGGYLFCGQGETSGDEAVSRVLTQTDVASQGAVERRPSLWPRA
jgi:hypothetical protein